MNIFENATRKNYMFASKVGELNVIMLWELPLTSTRQACLNDVAKGINAQLKAEQEDSFVEVSTNAKKTELEAKLEVVKHVIAVKMQENTDRAEAADKRARKAQLTELLARKRDQVLESKTVEEIEAELAAM